MKKNRTKLIQVFVSITLFALIAGFQNCAQVKFASSANKSSDSNVVPQGSPDPSPPPGGGTPQVFNFTEPDTSNKQLDVLFVVHATGSFNGQISSGVASGLTNFVTALGNIDYEIGVMLAYPGGPSSGVLFNASSNGSTGPVLSSSTMSLANIQTALSNDISQAPISNISFSSNNVNYSDVHGEFGTLALLNALQSPNLTNTRSTYNFFRPGAALAVIFAANESDNCFIDPTDTDGQEQSLKASLCGGVTAQSVVSAVQSAQGSNPFLFGFIGYGTDPLNASGNTIDEQEAGHGYLDVVNQTQGVVGNLDPNSSTVGQSQQNQITQVALSNIGALAKSKLQLTTQFTISNKTIASSINVYVNGLLLPSNQWSYNSISFIVTIAGVQSKDVVQIKYNTNP